MAGTLGRRSFYRCCRIKFIQGKYGMFETNDKNTSVNVVGNSYDDSWIIKVRVSFDKVEIYYEP